MKISKEELVDLIKGTNINDLNLLGLPVNGMLIKNYLPMQNFYFDLGLFDIFYKTDNGVLVVVVENTPSCQTLESDCYAILKNLAILKSINSNKGSEINYQLIIISNEHEKYMPLLSLSDDIKCFGWSLSFKTGVEFKKAHHFYSNEFLKGQTLSFSCTL